MMKNEQQVCSLELAKEMAALGFEQYSIWCWTWMPWNDEVIWSVILQRRYTMIKSHREQYAAYTVAELGEMLPSSVLAGGTKVYLSMSKLGDLFCIEYRLPNRKIHFNIREDQEANARAKMLILLREEKLI